MISLYQTTSRSIALLLSLFMKIEHQRFAANSPTNTFITNNNKYIPSFSIIRGTFKFEGGYLNPGIQELNPGIARINLSGITYVAKEYDKTKILSYIIFGAFTTIALVATSSIIISVQKND